MNCDNYKDLIPACIRRELSGETRAKIITHLKSCHECRNDYLRTLKIFYTLDAGNVEPEPEIDNMKIDTSFVSEPKGKKHIYLWLRIAAIMVIITVSGYMLFRTSTDQQQTTAPEQKISIKESLLQEDWEKLSTILNDKIVLERCSGERIPVTILIVKLKKLESLGLAYRQANVGAELSTVYYLDVKSFINTLESLKKYRSEISVNEISSYLRLI